MKIPLRWRLRRGGGRAVLLALVVGAFTAAHAAESPLSSGFALKDLSGTDIRLKDYRGKHVVLVFGELYQQNTLKAIQDVQKVLAAKPAYDRAVEVLIIVSDSSRREEYRKVKEQLAIPYPVLYDGERSVYGNYGIIALPTTFIIGPDGNVINRLPSYTIAYRDQVEAELGYALGAITREELASVMQPVSAAPPLPAKKERYLSLAEHLMRSGSPEGALHAYQEVLKLEPASPEAHQGLGMIYIAQSEADKAEEAFQFVLRQNPDDPAARRGMAQVYLLKGNLDKAEELLQKLNASGYADEEIFFVMGELYEKKGDFKEAMYYYKKYGQRSMPGAR